MKFHSPLFVRLAALLFSLATGTLHAELPPEAQAAMDRGVIAAKQQDYPLALRFFEEARKFAPESPELHFNLGLTESKIPGRELRAIAWFGAYLTANPTAPNAAAVRQQITVLDVGSQSSITRLLKTTRDAADQTSGAHRVERFLEIVRLWLDFSDLTEALKTANFMIHSEKDRDEMFRSEGKGLENEKNHVDAWRDFALRDIAFSQTSKGDKKSALKTVDLMSRSSTKSLVLVAIANADIEAGNSNAARKTLMAALKIAERIDREPEGYQTVEYTKSMAQARIAETQISAGDITGAESTTALIRYEYLKCLVQLQLAEAQIKAGNSAAGQKTMAAALWTAARIKGDEKGNAEKVIAEIQAKLASGSAASASTPQSPATDSKTVVTVTDWLQKLDDDGKESECPLDTEPFLDLAAYLKSMRSDDSDQVSYDLIHTSQKIVSAQNVIRGMLKQQAKQQTGK